MPYRQENFFGGHAHLDGTVKERMGGHNFAGLDARFENPAGLTGLWADENTRASLFEAMQRKETFATSGPRMQIRFFGGWDYASNLANSDDWVAAGYAGRVPMGGDLAAPPTVTRSGGTAPHFILWAVKGPTAANLDRIQIVKGWSQNGQSDEQVHDVVWSGDRQADPLTGKLAAIESTVDIASATYTDDTGSAELIAVWTDPDFDPSFDAFYYARALAAPTPRWTAIQAKEMGISPPEMVEADGAGTCVVLAHLASDARAKAVAGRMVDDLTSDGFVALTDDELEDLVSAKFLWLRKTVSGGIFETRWTEDGLFLIMNVDPRNPHPSELGDLQRHSYLGEAHSAWSIADGKLVTNFGNRDYTYAVHRKDHAGDPSTTAAPAADASAAEKPKPTYIFARSNEFGYANYEVIDLPVFLGTEITDAVVPPEPPTTKQ